ncbi:MAG: hypothetical protein M0042_06525 [Nitrospiraceae bacterium]|nr:hypothetical protein [Nitrospiraceae bacterium]
MRIDKSETKYWIGLLLIAAVFTLIEAVDLYKDVKAASWPYSIGKLYNRISPSTPPTEPYAGTPTMGPLLARDVDYSYTVHGIPYTSNNVSYGLTFSENFETSPNGTDHLNVKIYFNPLDPKESVLIPGPKILNLCLLALGAISTFWLFKYMRKTK